MTKFISFINNRGDRGFLNPASVVCAIDWDQLKTKAVVVYLSTGDEVVIPLTSSHEFQDMVISALEQ